MDNMKKEIVERFLKYVSFDTQSSEEAEGRCPSTEKQLRLAEYLVEELKEIGMQEVEMDAHGYVFATLSASEGMEEVPVVGFIAHMDTSPDCSRRAKLRRLFMPGPPNILLSRYNPVRRLSVAG